MKKDAQTKQPSKPAVQSPRLIHPQPPQDPKQYTMPTEPDEVLGRHKNSGQKDHKGAR